MAAVHDLLIRGGQVLDGTGASGRLADVAVRDGRIAAIAPALSDPARRVIDARDRVVAPGFIDVKTHSDWTLPVVPRAESKVRQGVTTEVIGHCGFSVAPALPGRVELLREYLAPSAPWYPFRATSFAEYLDGFPATSVNAVPLVGHNTLRLMATGMEPRAPRADELDLMRQLLDEALGAGALGLSSGLFTAPGSWATADEMVDLARRLRGRGALYATHIRDESRGVLAAVREALDTAERASVRLQLVHVKVSGTESWGGAGRFLAEVEAARARGVRVHCDQYPYTAASNPLRNLLPLWVQEGGVDAMLQRLAEPGARARIRRDIDADGLTSWGRIPSWEAVRIAISPHRAEHAGRTIADLARQQASDHIDAVCDYLIADRGATRIVITSMAEEDVREFLRSPLVLVGSDGFAAAPHGITSQGKPHPRYYGTFPRILGHYVRELGLLSLPEAVRKMTGASAAALGLADRGLLREGHAADVTIFDPATVIDQATYDDPHRYPLGVSHVLVNGVVVVDEGEHTGALPGRVLRLGPQGVS
jgi:N-acyl-D-aspartate/D-glutamate deacylase